MCRGLFTPFTRRRHGIKPILASRASLVRVFRWRTFLYNSSVLIRTAIKMQHSCRIIIWLYHTLQLVDAHSNGPTFLRFTPESGKKWYERRVIYTWQVVAPNGGGWSSPFPHISVTWFMLLRDKIVQIAEWRCARLAVSASFERYFRWNFGLQPV